MRRLGILSMLTVVLGCAGAGSAFAGTAVTNTASWAIAGGETISSSTITCEKASKSTNPVLRSTILGMELELTATGVECLESTISTVTVSGTHMAVGSGKARFTGVTVTKPAGCEIASTLTTNALNATLQMDKTESSRNFVRLEPVSGATGTIATVTLSGCAAAGKFPIKGFLYGTESPTSSFAQAQTLNFELTTEAMSGLKVGEEAATFAGFVTFKLAGGNTGKNWLAEAK